MPRQPNIAAAFTEVDIPLDADEATLRQELERRGWQVRIEEPLSDRVGRGSRGRQYRALAIQPNVRPHPEQRTRSFRHVQQNGPTPEAALRKVLAAVLSQEASER